MRNSNNFLQNIQVFQELLPSKVNVEHTNHSDSVTDHFLPVIFYMNNLIISSESVVNDI